MSIHKLDDFFRLDAYFLFMLLMLELSVWTVLTNLMYNVFGLLTPPKVTCNGVDYVPKKTPNFCAIYSPENCTIGEVSFDSFANLFLGDCASTSWLKQSTNIQMLGLIVGAFLSGYLSDRYGRRPVMIGSFVACSVLSVSLAASSSGWQYFALRGLIGFPIGSLLTVSLVYAVEGFPSKHRFMAVTIVTWAPNYMLWAPLAYYAHQWQRLCYFTNIISCLIYPLLLLLLVESPRFLLQRNRRQEAIDALAKINRWNREKISRPEIETIVDRELAAMHGTELLRTPLLENGVEKKVSQQGAAKVKSYTWIDLFATRELSIYTIFTSISIFSVALTTYALTFNMDAVSGSIYWNFFIGASIRWTIALSVASFDKLSTDKVGRKTLHTITASMILLCIFLIYISSAFNWESRDLIKRWLTLIAFGFTGTVFIQCMMITSEVFPTSIRNNANGNLNAWSKVGTLVGPNLLPWFDALPQFPALVYLVMAFITLIDIAGFHFMLPETKNIALPSATTARSTQKATAAAR